MNEISEVYKQLAEEQRMYFDWFRSIEIFVKMYSDDLIQLNRLQEICGGRVSDGSYTHRQSRDLDRWGRYVWHVDGEEAYQFCLSILPYLGKLHPKRQYCQQCINVHEDRRHKSTGT
jgi:hypothetical protein